MKSIIVEFCGMPNSGKSTTIRRLSALIRRKGYTCSVITEGVRNSPVKPKAGFGYNLWGILRMTAKLLEAKNSEPDLIIIDRGFVDLSVFSNSLYQGKYISGSEFKILQETCKLLMPLISMYLLFLVDPEKSLLRDKKHSGDKAGIIMNPEFLASLYAKYKRNLKKNAVAILESGNKSAGQIYKETVGTIVKLLEN